MVSIISVAHVGDLVVLTLLSGVQDRKVSKDENYVQLVANEVVTSSVITRFYKEVLLPVFTNVIPVNSMVVMAWLLGEIVKVQIFQDGSSITFHYDDFTCVGHDLEVCNTRGIGKDL